MASGATVSVGGKRRFGWLKPAAIAGVIGFAVGQFPTYYDHYREWFNEPLYVTVPSMRQEPAPILYRMYKVRGLYQLVPAPLLIYVRVHNAGQKPITLRSYVVFISVGNEWQLLVPLRNSGVPTADSTIIVFWRKEAIKRLDLAKDSFDYKAASQSIGANDTMSGWMFFENRVNDLSAKLKFEFNDRENAVHRIETQLITQPSESGQVQLDQPSFTLGPNESIPEELRTYADSLPQ